MRVNYKKIAGKCMKIMEKVQKERAVLRGFILENAVDKKVANEMLGGYGTEKFDETDIAEIFASETFVFLMQAFSQAVSLKAVNAKEYDEKDNVFATYDEKEKGWDTRIEKRGYEFSKILRCVENDKLKEWTENENLCSPEMKDAIRHCVCFFDDVLALKDRSIQKWLREVDTKDLAKALKNAKPEISERFFTNMSNRAGAMLKEDIDKIAPSDTEIFAARNRMVDALLSLVEKDEIILESCC